MLKSPHRKSRRSDGSIATPLECFRKGQDSVNMRNALAELAMRLVDSEDRDKFRKADGVTTLGRSVAVVNIRKVGQILDGLLHESVDHIGRVLEEQATQNYVWITSEAFGPKWEEFEVHDALQFALVAVCHASIDSDIAAEMHELGTLETLYQVLYSLPPKLNDYSSFVLESMRNLCCSNCIHNGLPTDFVPSIWNILLADNETSTYRKELAAEVLGNVAAIVPAIAVATPDKLAATLSLFLATATGTDAANFGIALADLLCNLCCDPDVCLLLICELDTRRPRGRTRHSGVVYLAELSDKTDDDALKQSMEALVHNLSWSDPAGKRSIQKLALSSFMNRFALEPAI